MNRSQTVSALTQQIINTGSDRKAITALVEIALKLRDDRAARIVENSDLDCLIPSEIAEKIRSDDLESF